MKKVGIAIAIIVVIILVIVGVVFLNKNSETTSTATSSTTATEENQNTVQETENTEDVYVFEDNGKQIPLGAEYSSLNLGDAKDYYEVQSCAFDGMDKIYTFDNYEVHTYPENGTDKVLSVYFLDDQVSTTEGVKIGDSLDKMTQTYGTDYEQLDTQYTYTKGLTQLIFIVEDGSITSIEYNYNVA